MDFDSLFGARLREVRKSLDLSQDQAAAACGVSREMWGKYERGAASPGAKVLAALALTGADVSYVLTGRLASSSNRKAPVDADLLVRVVARLTETATALKKRWPEERKLALAVSVYNFLVQEEGEADDTKIDRTLRLVVNQ